MNYFCGLKCTDCEKIIDHDVKHLAYYSNEVPVHLRRCKACINEKWLKYKEMLKRDDSDE